MSGSVASESPEPVLRPGAGQMPLQVVAHSLAATALFVLNLAPAWRVLLTGLVALNLMVQWRRIRRLRGCRILRRRGRWWLQSPGAAPRPVTCRYRFLSPWLVVMELSDSASRRRMALLPAAATRADWRHLHRLARAEWRSTLRDD